MLWCSIRVIEGYSVSGWLILHLLVRLFDEVLELIKIMLLRVLME